MGQEQCGELEANWHTPEVCVDQNQAPNVSLVVDCSLDQSVKNEPPRHN